MTTTSTLTQTTASNLRAGDLLHRVIKNAGRTRVFESPIDATIEATYPTPDHSGYVTIVLGSSRLNLLADRAVIVSA